MSIPGGPMGVQNRLLPPAIPFRFFGTATFFLTLTWVLLFLSGDELIGYAGGPGFVLAGIHSLTLGVLTMTAMGASLQLLPVATRQAFGNLNLCRLLRALHTVATLLLVSGMATAEVTWMAWGGGLAFISMCLFGWLISGNLRRGSGMTVVILHCWSAFAALIILTILGIALALNPTTGWIEDVATVAAIHFLIAGFGFMGLFAIGFSYILLPMFVLSPAPSDKAALLALTAYAIGVVIAIGGLYLDISILLWFGGLAGLFGIALHLRLMLLALKARMQKKLDPPFVLIRFAWILCPLSIIWGLFAFGSGIGGESSRAIFGLLVLAWLLSFLLGILLRILPFLGSMHASRPGQAPPLLSALVPKNAQITVVYGQIATVILLLIGLIVASEPVLQIATALGVFSGLAMISYFITVVYRVWFKPS